MARVSVILTTQSSGDTVAQGVESCLAQTLEDIELILVDDGSDEGVRAVFQACAQKDPRVRVADSRGRGAFAAIKAGVLAAGASHVLFLGGHDKLGPLACQEALSAALGQGTDMLFLAGEPAVKEVNLADPLPDRWGGPPPREDIHRPSAFLLARAVPWTLTGKLFARNVLVTALAELDGLAAAPDEELLFLFFVCLHAGGCGVVNGPLYLGNGGAQRPRAEEYRVLSFVRTLARGRGHDERFQKTLDDLTRAVYGNAAAFLLPLPGEEARQALASFLEHWPADELLAALFGAVSMREEAPFARLSALLKVMPGLEGAKKPVNRVGIFYYRLFSGGVERVISALSSVFAENGLWVTIITQTEPTPQDYPLPPNVSRVVLPPEEDNLRRIQGWRRVVKEQNLDAVLYNAWLDECMPMDAAAVKSAGAAFLLHTHGPFPMGLDVGKPVLWQYFTHQKNAYALCDGVIALNEVDVQWFESLGLKAALVQNPMPFSPQSIAPSPLDGETVLWVGRMSMEKQPMDALRIMLALHSQVPTARLVMAGSFENADLVAQAKAFIAKNNMEDYVELTGYVTDMRPCYRQAAALLWTSSTEGAPLGLIEAMTYGLPMVVYDLCGVDIVRAGRGMITVEQGDVSAAARALAGLLTDKALGLATGAQARQAALDYAAYDYMGRWRSIFDMALAPAPTPPLLSTQPAAVVAAHLAMRFAWWGGNHLLLNDAGYYATQCNALDKTLKEVRASFSYRLGMALTRPLRALKNILAKRRNP